MECLKTVISPLYGTMDLTMDLSSIIDLRSLKNEENMRRNKRGEGRQEPSERRDERQNPRGETSVFNKSKFRGPM